MSMNLKLQRIISELQAEKQLLDEAILALEKVARERPRRGRPRKLAAAAMSGAEREPAVEATAYARGAGHGSY